MPLTSLKPPKVKFPKETVVTWNTWRKGLNTLLRTNEVDAAEMTQATNLLLVGSGVPTKRWGSQNYFLAGATGSVNFLQAVKDSSNNQQVLALTDWGLLTKKNGASYTQITGASWPSGSDMAATQLGGNVYIVSTLREMVKYDFTSLIPNPAITSPTGVNVTNMSSATGTYTWSWVITAIGRGGGETDGSIAVSAATLPQYLDTTVMRVRWTAVSTASGDLLGYNVYRGAPGDERFIGGVDNLTTQFDDTGGLAADPFRTPPDVNTTGGTKAKYILRYNDRLILSGIPDAPTRVLISGRWPDQERFDWNVAGGSLEIEPDSGENVTGLGIHQEKLIVFKENSVWQIGIAVKETALGGLLDATYQLLTASQGCTSHRSIVPVENDLMFANRRGIYILRYEPQLLTVLNANEISAKIRPFFESLSDDDHTSSCAAYIDKKYIISYPNSRQSVIFDRERLSFMGSWLTPFGINSWTKYVDPTGIERWVAADADDNYVTEFNASYPDDKNTAIHTVFKSRKEDFKDWTTFKTINEVYFNFRNVIGNLSVNLYIEDRNGNTVVAKALTVSTTGTSGTSGFGTDLMGSIQYGLTANTPTITTLELPKKTTLYKSSRTFQVEIRTDAKNNDYELLGITTTGISQPRGNSPSGWRLS